MEKLKYASKTFPFRQIQQIEMTLFQYHLTSSIKQSIYDLQRKQKSMIDTEVNGMIDEIKNKYQVNLDGITNSNQLKYIISKIFWMENTFKNSLRSNAEKKMKKTSITIDFDFSNVISLLQEKQNKMNETISKDKNIISKLQDLMLQKQKEIAKFQDNIEYFKERINDLIHEGQQKEGRFLNQLSQAQGKYEKEKVEKEKLKASNQKIKQELQSLKQDNCQQIDEFLRRCLFTQAISIEGFLNQRM